MATDLIDLPEPEIPVYIWKPRPRPKTLNANSPPEFDPSTVDPPIGRVRGDFCLGDLVSLASPEHPGKRWRPAKSTAPPKTRLEHHHEENSEEKGQVADLFKYIVARFAVLGMQFNEAYTMWGKKPEEAAKLYDETSEAYTDFVKDLDNRELPKDDKDDGKGYGRPIKWVDLKPDIRPENDKDLATKGPIKGLQVVVKWNPCTSRHRGSY